MLTAALIVLIMASAAVALWLRRSAGVRSQQTALRALDDCAVLLQLVRALQQHRGMSVAWLGGERSFGPRMNAGRQETDRCIASLDATAHAEDLMPRACLTHNDLVLFRFHWRELVDLLDNDRIAPDQSIARHGQLIARALEWLEALGESRVELGVGDRVNAGRVRNHVSSLPMLAECLGQARAIGTGIATRGQCAPVARVRLMFLASRAESLQRQALSAAGNSRTATDAGRQVDAMLGIVRNTLLGGQGRISAQDWFAEATRAIDDVYAWIDECGVDVRRDLVAPSGAMRWAATE